ncbi:antisig_RsrA, mycothiol system anti-sigma-R factor [Candidatus Nanopelagicaceae bacterium]
MSYIEIQCGDVLSSVIFIIEGELEQLPQRSAIEEHISTCLPCTTEIAHERAMHDLLQETLRRTCNERAPEDLHEAIHRQLRAQMAGATEVFTQFSMTEISIEIDEFGNIEHREIQIEQTHIQHFIDQDPDETR